ncbi:MAG: hypothetical protein KZQ64_10575 [gamma proteobacterium symbiont of Bathyaustriella thionipta]|nr:hypothetical protein [gamma proteobacterium symbiont of Bathyaustriella thionipta]MCU7951059.1 hypothetical protein [gamma proteobacterium symbiont of Bathyaustriella thionipta]MCU7953817.1 hypothetical protein [gamma proteobacterium symbiont of Bathyaustriella thionipta]MCU7957596.1 hypothetical protein [gamma proteobacterium symbiont of Bathyaustriella thionipta]MCU7966884.1 hypothetical protein [gamma proteobacterium symbiont of Bathyaustriella thionipta]
MKQLSLEDISRLNLLLDDTLNQASKEQLATCIKLLGTSLAHLKIKHKVDEDKNAQAFSDFVEELENESLSSEFNELAAKTIVECATAMAVAKEGKIEK